MNKKISLGIALSLVAIGCAITFVLTWTVSRELFNSKIASSEKYEGIYEKLRQIDAIVRSNYIGQSQIDDDALGLAMVNGYISGIGDKYAGYMPATSYYEFQQTLNGIVNGAGFQAEDNGSGYLIITEIYKNSSADLNGLMIGDVITAIDGRSLLNMGTDAAIERISGEIGTTLSLNLVRGGEELAVTLIRQQIEIESVTDELLENNIGYIKVTTFNEKTSDQFSTSLNSLIGRNINGLIIDLRQNGGGVVNALKPMLNRIITAAVVATAEYADGARETLVETDSGESLNIPIAILVDGGTASAAEIFAVALRDEHGAVLVGTQTYGKAVMQHYYSFPDGSGLTITTARVLPSKSASYDGVGLRPDYIVELPSGTTPDYMTRESDTQLKKAIEVLSPEIAGQENQTEQGNN